MVHSMYWIIRLIFTFYHSKLVMLVSKRLFSNITFLVPLEPFSVTFLIYSNVTVILFIILGLRLMWSIIKQWLLTLQHSLTLSSHWRLLFINVSWTENMNMKQRLHVCHVNKNLKTNQLWDFHSTEVQEDLNLCNVT